MKVRHKQSGSDDVSLRKIVRFVFVVFSLYLMGDAFYRWDGFRFYASFGKFIPAVALIFIFWTVIALIASVLLWLILRTSSLLCMTARVKINPRDIQLFIISLFLTGAAAFYSTRLLPEFGSEIQVISVLLGLSFILSVLITVLLRGFHYYFYKILDIIQERITPLVWLFSILLVISIPVVSYQAWFKDYGNSPQKLTKADQFMKNRPDIILLTFDALTAKDMSLYGYERDTTPFIRNWAEKAFVFSRAEAESNNTTPTTASLMTGKRLWTHRTIHQKGSKPINIDTENLPLLLRDHGYHTMAFVTNSYASTEVLGIDDNFDIAPPVTTFHQTAKGFDSLERLVSRSFGGKIRLYDWLFKEDFIFFKIIKYFLKDHSSTDVVPKIAFNSFLKILKKNPSKPYFAWIHILPPHDPYLPPSPFMGMYEPSQDLKTRNSQRGLLQRRFNEKLAMTARGRYDEFIRYCDSQFESFIQKINKTPLLKDTIIILSADHGESFEHNRIGHSFTSLYEETTHIPLIIKKPRQDKGMIIDQVVEQIDIPATILDLAGIETPSWMEGRSLLPFLNGNTVPSKAAFSGFFDNNLVSSEIKRGVIAVWEGDYKLIYYLDSGNSELFNLKKDPAELTDLFDIKKEISGRLLRLAKENLQNANRNIRLLK